MTAHPQSFHNLVDQAKALGPIRVAVADAAQGLVIEVLGEAHALGLVEPSKVGRAALIPACDYTTAITGEVLHGDAGFHVEGMVFH
jgi:enoyl-[acyl-carrier-protein] reductase (NADH)